MLAATLRRTAPPLAVCACLIGGNAAAQDAQDPLSGGGGRRGFSVEPSVTLGATVSDRSNATENNPEVVGRATAAVSMRADGARVRGTLDYALSSVLHAEDSSRNEWQNSLSALANAELVDNWMFLDVGASISQQLISPFGTRTVDDSISNDNRNEVASLRVSPSVRGRLGGFADYTGSAHYTTTHSASSASSDSDNAAASFSLSRQAPPRAFGWSATAGRQITDFALGRRTERDSLDLALTYAVSSQLSLSALAGHESHNFNSADKKSYTSGGFGITWVPSPRTSLSAERQNRYFGSSHSFSFSHRARRTVWTYTDSRSVTTPGDEQIFAGLGTAYDLLFQQLASAIPNPVLRDLAVRQYLRERGIDPRSQVVTSFLYSALTLQRRQVGAVAWIGARNTVTFALTRSDGRRLDQFSGALDAFSESTRIRQAGYEVGISHRLTPQQNLNARFTRQASRGDSELQDTQLHSIDASWSVNLGRDATASLGARYVRFSSPNSPSTERALTGSFTQRF